MPYVELDDYFCKEVNLIISIIDSYCFVWHMVTAIFSFVQF